MTKKSTDSAYQFEVIENQARKLWQKLKIFKFNPQKKQPLYVVDTPPPYVSADHLHSGHIMSYAQAEFIVRYKRMRGFNVFYSMGFDDNGLPTERFVEKKYQINKNKISKSKFIKLCLKETEIGSRTYKKLWDNLGISVDWSKTYSTISPIAQKISQWSLIDLNKKGGLYQKQVPILWCTTCRTAIAQADLEDKEQASKMNYIDFQGQKDQKLTIATTRPELIPACVALYVHPKDKRYADLIGSSATPALCQHQVPIKANPNVDPEKGTGLIMVCTWGDVEDLEKWRLDKLPTRSIIQENGKLNQLAGPYQGLTIQEARNKILKDLKNAGLLRRQEKINHTLNVHERCDTPMELVKSRQWFIKIANLQKTWLKYGRQLNWYPKSMFKIYQNWVQSLKWDWCISRQRYFGVPIPVWSCQKCDHKIFAKIKDLPVNPLEDPAPVKKCPGCQNSKLQPESDVMDTWATSACTPFLLRELVGKNRQSVYDKMFPVSLRPNAFEIIRTWDFYSIVKSHYNFKKIPFKDVMISGHGLDEHGRKISKRLGNYQPSDRLLQQYGADAIRYWATGASLGQNLRFNAKEIKKGRKTAIKLFNINKFLSIHLEELSQKHIKSISQNLNQNKDLEPADLWILKSLNQCIKKTTTAFENYNYAGAKNTIHDFFWSQFADYYVEFIKYRLANSRLTASKKAALAVLYQVFFNIAKLYAPIIPFITEYVYRQSFSKNHSCESIHVCSWPEKLAFSGRINQQEFNQALAAIDEIRTYKSKQGLALGKEIPTYQLKTRVNLTKFRNFISQVMKVKKLT
ncbi:MAG: valine--tRNA ligase [Candidatus Moranbacteria bacterium]|nr:valine--tRNA ligase [Candidatus Moranbacteria bacterium]